MSWYRWEASSRDMYQACRNYNKAFVRFRKNTCSESHVQNAFDDLLITLKHPNVVARINQVLDARSRQKQPLTLQEIQEEAKFSHLLGVKKSIVLKTFDIPDVSLREPQTITCFDDVVIHMSDIHRKTIQETKQSRHIDSRIEKKVRKRNVGQAVTSGLFGLGCGVVNSYSFRDVPEAKISYSVALICFHQAARDLVGERSD
ncbi:hypothetical protein [Marinomonas mediterranea]|uniref:hypothetical protein n=1 Tax=Marinomonas mediterranea TaxID=119864 RepID=UPI0023499215|nr:hypothetical protein [Marinomonas mediterranea]WCN09977.1 hypothetical protein GV055_14135 [Marinomonas mediterranea]